MDEIKCMECGEVLSKGVTECSKCGCPVSYSQQEKKVEEEQMPYIAKSNEQINKKNLVPILPIVIGVIVVVLGVFVLSHKADVKVYEASTYDIDTAVFGADFYTEIYSASDTIVDELNDINGGMASISSSIVSIIDAVYYSAGMIIIALGLGIISISLINISKLKN